MKSGLATRTRNLFHVIKLTNGKKPRGSVKGTIETWQFRVAKGWTPSTYESADFPHRTGFGCYINTSDLADRVAKKFRSLHVDCVQWGSLSGQFPELKFIPPGMFNEFAQNLVGLGIELSPPPPAEPRYIGVVQ